MRSKAVHTIQKTMAPSADLQEEIKFWTRYVNEWNAWAPTVKRMAGNMSRETYAEESRKYSRFDRQFMLPWLQYLRKRHKVTLPERTFYHFGTGHGDDCGYIADALTMGFALKVEDIVPLALTLSAKRIENTYRRRSLVRTQLPKPESLMKIRDWKETISSPDFNADEVVGCKVGRLLYHYDPKKVKKILGDLGKLLQQRGTLIVLIHHCPEFNQGYEYKTSRPYYLEEILKPLREVAGKDVRILNERRILEDTLKYFDYQNLTWLAIGRV